MYRYGTQLLVWQSKTERQTENIKRYVFFNDGDAKTTKEKVIGQTGGFYMTRGSTSSETLAMMQKCASKGKGGDFPENDIEAILYAIKNYPQTQEIVLIADNDSQVRDISLLPQVTKPVRVVMTHIKNAKNINPQYLKIAAVTKGSLHLRHQDYTLNEVIEWEKRLSKWRSLSEKEKKKLLKKQKRTIRKAKRKH